MRYRTDLMKAEVRRQMEGLHEYGPDPAAEVLPDRPMPRLRHDGGHVHVTFTVDPSALKAAFDRAARQMSARTATGGRGRSPSIAQSPMRSVTSSSR